KDRPRPQIDPEDWLASNEKPDLPPIVAPNLSLIRTLQELRQTEQAGPLLSKLKRDDAVHVHMLCRDPGKGLHQLRDVLTARGVQLIVDYEAQVRLNDRALSTRTTFVLYTENVTPDEMLAVVRELGQKDLKAAKKNKAPVQFRE